MKSKCTLSAIVLFLPFVAWGQAQEEPKTQTSQKTETQTDSVKTRQLDEVKVVAYKRIDKGSKGVQIFEPNFEALSEASPMIKALNLLPGVGGANGSYKIMGSHRTAIIYIDGKPSTHSQLSNLLAKDIKHIEVNPFHRDGEVINIVRHKVSHSKYMGRLRATAGIPTDFYAGTFFNYQNKTWELNTDLVYYNKLTHTEGYRELHLGGLTEREEYESRQRDKQGYGEVMLHHTPSEVWRTTAQTTFLLSGRDLDNWYQTAGQAKRIYKPQSQGQQYNVGLTTEYDLSKHLQLRWRGTLDQQKEEERNPQLSQSYLYNPSFRSLATDLTLAVKNLKVGASESSFGGRYAYYNDVSSLGTNQGEYRNSMHGLTLYGNLYRGKWSLGAKGVLRYVQTHYGVGERGAWEFEPTVALSYRAGRAGNFRLTYTRSVSRPSASELSLLTRQSGSALGDYQGNTELRNSMLDTYALSYSKQIKRSYLSLSLVHSERQDVIRSVLQNTYASGNYLHINQNAGRYRETELSANVYSSLLGGKMSLNLHASLGYVDNKVLSPYRGTMADESGWTSTLRYYLNYQITKTTSIGSYCYWPVQNRYARGGSFRSTPFYNIELEQLLFNNRVTVSLHLNDFLARGYSSTYRPYAMGYEKNYSQDLNGRRILLGISWRFGKSYEQREGASRMSRSDRDVSINRPGL